MSEPGQPFAPDVPAGGDDGFTLLELLVSLILLAAVLALLPGAFRMAHRVWSSEAEMAAESQLSATRAYLSRTMATAMPLVVRSASGRIGVAFSGTADSVSFIAPARSGPDGAGIYRHTLQAVPAARGDRHALVLVQSMVLADPGQVVAGGSERVLLETASGLRFRYYGADRAGGQRTWRELWTRGDSLPELIELGLSGPDPSGRGWLPLIMRPQLAPAG